MNLHILRCHNRNLNLGLSVLIMLACAYTLQRPDINALQFYGSIAASVVTVLWGGYYYLLHYVVDESGITRCLLTKKHYDWSEITHLELQRKEHNSQLSLSVIGTLADDAAKPLRLSSELLRMESVEELVADLREQGKLPPAPIEPEAAALPDAHDEQPPA